MTNSLAAERQLPRLLFRIPKLSVAVEHGVPDPSVVRIHNVLRQLKFGLRFSSVNGNIHHEKRVPVNGRSHGDAPINVNGTARTLSAGADVRARRFCNRVALQTLEAKHFEHILAPLVWKI